MNLAEDYKVVSGYCSTLWADPDNADWIEMKNANAVWAIVHAVNLTTALTLTPYIADNVAGTGSSAISKGAKFWYDNNCGTLDRLTASTNSTALALADSTAVQLAVMRYDPAAVSASSKDCFKLGGSSQTAAGTGTVNIVYIIEPRYKGDQAIIATTSST
jgi:hypothetical protein